MLGFCRTPCVLVWSLCACWHQSHIHLKISECIVFIFVAQCFILWGGELCKQGVLDMNLINLQEKDTEKILYGVDDIKQASDIIIVIILSTCCLCWLCSPSVLSFSDYIFNFENLDVIDRLRVKWISFQWKKLATLIVWAFQMEHPPRCPTKSYRPKERSWSTLNICTLHLTFSLQSSFFPLLSHFLSGGYVAVSIASLLQSLIRSTYSIIKKTYWWISREHRFEVALLFSVI